MDFFLADVVSVSNSTQRGSQASNQSSNPSPSANMSEIPPDLSSFSGYDALKEHINQCVIAFKNDVINHSGMVERVERRVMAFLGNHSLVMADHSKKLLVEKLVSDGLRENMSSSGLAIPSVSGPPPVAPGDLGLPAYRHNNPFYGFPPQPYVPFFPHVPWMVSNHNYPNMVSQPPNHNVNPLRGPTVPILNAVPPVPPVMGNPRDPPTRGPPTRGPPLVVMGPSMSGQAGASESGSVSDVSGATNLGEANNLNFDRGIRYDCVIPQFDESLSLVPRDSSWTDVISAFNSAWSCRLSANSYPTQKLVKYGARGTTRTFAEW
jgi:hypothetical protein